jgi:hypothetical protein
MARESPLKNAADIDRLAAARLAGLAFLRSLRLPQARAVARLTR